MGVTCCTKTSEMSDLSPQIGVRPDMFGQVEPSNFAADCATLLVAVEIGTATPN